MRPVNQARHPVKARGHSGRTPSRGITRGQGQQPFGRRSKFRNDPVSRFFRSLKASLTVRRPMLWLTLALLLITGLAAVLYSGIVGRTVHRTGVAADAFAAGAGFGLAQVHLAGNARTDAGTIMAALAFKPGEPIFKIDLNAARARLMQLPWVADAEVKRRYPDDISIRIVERVPFARWHAASGLYVVERSGRPITAQDADKFLALPLLVGEGAPDTAAPLVQAVQRRRALAAHVAAYQYQSGRRWNLLLDNDVVVKLPETDWDRQLADLERLIVVKHILDADIGEIDLRSPKFYFVVRKGAAADKEKKPITGSAI